MLKLESYILELKHSHDMTQLSPPFSDTTPVSPTSMLGQTGQSPPPSKPFSPSTVTTPCTSVLGRINFLQPSVISLVFSSLLPSTGFLHRSVQQHSNHPPTMDLTGVLHKHQPHTAGGWQLHRCNSQHQLHTTVQHQLDRSSHYLLRSASGNSLQLKARQYPVQLQSQLCQSNKEAF